VPNRKKENKRMGKKIGSQHEAPKSGRPNTEEENKKKGKNF